MTRRVNICNLLLTFDTNIVFDPLSLMQSISSELSSNERNLSLHGLCGDAFLSTRTSLIFPTPPASRIGPTTSAGIWYSRLCRVLRAYWTIFLLRSPSIFTNTGIVRPLKIARRPASVSVILFRVPKSVFFTSSEVLGLFSTWAMAGQRSGLRTNACRIASFFRNSSIPLAPSFTTSGSDAKILHNELRFEPY